MCARSFIGVATHDGVTYDLTVTNTTPYLPNLAEDDDGYSGFDLCSAKPWLCDTNASTSSSSSSSSSRSSLSSSTGDVAHDDGSIDGHVQPRDDPGVD